MARATCGLTAPRFSRVSTGTCSSSVLDWFEYVTKPRSTTSDEPAISVRHAATRPPVHDSAVTMRRPAFRYVSRSSAAAAMSAGSNGISARHRYRGDGLRRNALAPSGEPKALRGRGFDAHAAFVEPEDAGDPRYHRCAMWRNLGTLADQCDVDVGNAATLGGDEAGRVGEKLR